MMKAATFFLVWVLATSATGVAAESPCAKARDVWVLQMENPVREYAVRLSALQTITLQDYDMRKDGQLRRVVELTVETTGGNRARIFWEDEAEELLPEELARAKREVSRAVRDLTGQDPGTETGRLQKDYPTTTHGGWTEFKMCSEQEVRDLHQKLMEFWTGRSGDE